jgi:flagellin
MPLNIISNFAANVAHRNLTMSDAQATSSLAKLSAGTRVLGAKDAAASLAIGNRLNAGQAVSMLQIADGAMAKTNDILVPMKSLSVQSGSGQLSATERQMLDTEFQALVSEIDRIANDTEFAGSQLVNGAIIVDTASAAAFSTDDGVADIIFRGAHSTAGDATIEYATSGAFSVSHGTINFSGSMSSDTNNGSNMTNGTVVTLTNSTTTLKVDIVLDLSFDVDLTKADGSLGLTGSNVSRFTFKVGTGTTAASDDISVTVNSISAASLGLGSSSVTTETLADTASAALTTAIDDLQTYRAVIGANQNRLEFAGTNIATATENNEAARSQLLDLDVAAEMSMFTSKQILVQAGVSMLAQANQLP